MYKPRQEAATASRAALTGPVALKVLISKKEGRRTARRITALRQFQEPNKMLLAKRRLGRKKSGPLTPLQIWTN